ncbi:MAG: DUF3800 domain-containing protein [Deltaproteobacteria bacterium]|nr:DUF3800 domain-containing protein [Deltaproteobacteria bacterium]
MFICYVDESGTPEVPGTTSHYVLAGVAVPVQSWTVCDQQISRLKANYGLEGAEMHTAYLMRKYIEQAKISDFETLSWEDRRKRVLVYRAAKLDELRKKGPKKLHDQTKKDYSRTIEYVHLTFDERKTFVRDVAEKVSEWQFARLFAECIDKRHDPKRIYKSNEYQAFEQVITRFQHFLAGKSRSDLTQYHGIVVHDNNPTVAKKHSDSMHEFYSNGTFWTRIKNIVETPFFVDSKLTMFVQIADMCSYALRRYLENKEEELFDLVFKRADRVSRTAVGVRHFTKRPCPCKICRAHTNHRPPRTPRSAPPPPVAA